MTMLTETISIDSRATDTTLIESGPADHPAARPAHVVDRLATGRLAVLTVLAGMWMVGGLMLANGWFARSNIGEALFAVQLAFDADTIRDQYARLIDQGTLDTYIVTQVLDYLFITGLAAFGWLLHRLIARAHSPGSHWHRLARLGGLLVVTSAGFDAVENLVAFAMLADPSGFPSLLAPIYSSLAAAKWAIAFIGVPLLAVELGAVIARRIRRPATA